MSPELNQPAIRPSTLSGSPNRKAARFGSLNQNGGTMPGTASTCQSRNSPSSSSNCQTRSALVLLLLRIAFQHLGFHRAPNLPVQIDEARRESNLGDVARPG